MGNKGGRVDVTAFPQGVVTAADMAARRRRGDEASPHGNAAAAPVEWHRPDAVHVHLAADSPSDVPSIHAAFNEPGGGTTRFNGSSRPPAATPAFGSADGNRGGGGGAVAGPSAAVVAAASRAAAADGASGAAALHPAGSATALAAASPAPVLEMDADHDGYFTPSQRRLFEGSIKLATPKFSGKIHWKKGELIGSGAFGRVYLGLHLTTGELMAAKEIAIGPQGTPQAESIVMALQNEIDLMRKLDHENIVRYFGTESDATTFTIFMEYVPGGSIASLVKRFGRFDEPLIRVYTKQILKGLHYLHSHKIMHRDIKGGNILVDRSGVCKLSDFGASKRLASLRSATGGPQSLRGTPYWMAPEVIRQTGAGRQADIWSVGCTIIEMATGKPPWSHYDTPVAALFHIAVTEEPPELPRGLTPAAYDFLRLCLTRDPAERPNAHALLTHPFIVGPFVPTGGPDPPPGVAVPGDSAPADRPGFTSAGDVGPGYGSSTGGGSSVGGGATQVLSARNADELDRHSRRAPNTTSQTARSSYDYSYGGRSRGGSSASGGGSGGGGGGGADGIRDNGGSVGRRETQSVDEGNGRRGFMHRMFGGNKASVGTSPETAAKEGKDGHEDHEEEPRGKAASAGGDAVGLALRPPVATLSRSPVGDASGDPAHVPQGYFRTGIPWSRNESPAEASKAASAAASAAASRRASREVRPVDGSEGKGADNLAQGVSDYLQHEMEAWERKSSGPSTATLHSSGASGNTSSTGSEGVLMHAASPWERAVQESVRSGASHPNPYATPHRGGGGGGSGGHGSVGERNARSPGRSPAHSDVSDASGNNRKSSTLTSAGTATLTSGGTPATSDDYADVAAELRRVSVDPVAATVGTAQAEVEGLNRMHLAMSPVHSGGGVRHPGAVSGGGSRDGSEVDDESGAASDTGGAQIGHFVGHRRLTGGSGQFQVAAAQYSRVPNSSSAAIGGSAAGPRGGASTVMSEGHRRSPVNEPIASPVHGASSVGGGVPLYGRRSSRHPSSVEGVDDALSIAVRRGTGAVAPSPSAGEPDGAPTQRSGNGEWSPRSPSAVRTSHGEYAGDARDRDEREADRRRMERLRAGIGGTVGSGRRSARRGHSPDAESLLDSPSGSDTDGSGRAHRSPRRARDGRRDPDRRHREREYGRHGERHSSRRRDRRSRDDEYRSSDRDREYRDRDPYRSSRDRRDRHRDRDRSSRRRRSFSGSSGSDAERDRRRGRDSRDERRSGGDRDRRSRRSGDDRDRSRRDRDREHGSGRRSDRRSGRSNGSGGAAGGAASNGHGTSTSADMSGAAARQAVWEARMAAAGAFDNGQFAINGGM